MLQELISLFKQIPIRPEMVCVGCDSEVLTEEHHLCPQATGGTNWRTVWLCPTCHNIVHAQARVMLSAKAETRNKNYYSSAENKIHLEPVVKIAAISRRLLADNKDLYENVAIQSVTIPVSPAQLARLHKLKAIRGFTSMDAFLKSLIEHITQLKSTPKEGRD